VKPIDYGDKYPPGVSQEIKIRLDKIESEKKRIIKDAIIASGRHTSAGADKYLEKEYINDIINNKKVPLTEEQNNQITKLLTEEKGLVRAILSAAAPAAASVAASTSGGRRRKRTRRNRKTHKRRRTAK